MIKLVILTYPCIFIITILRQFFHLLMRIIIMIRIIFIKSKSLIKIIAFEFDFIAALIISKTFKTTFSIFNSIFYTFTTILMIF
jgi:hypothetical protein